MNYCNKITIINKTMNKEIIEYELEKILIKHKINKFELMKILKEKDYKKIAEDIFDKYKKSFDGLA